MKAKKRVFVTIVTTAVFAVLLFGLVPNMTQAAEPCSFISASGIGFEFKGDDCSELLANYMVALNTFFYRLAIVLAVLMITIGGFQWLIAMGNASKISAAKETIEQAVIGLALAFTAYLIFSQIDERFVKLGSLELGSIDIKTSCDKINNRLSCENLELTKPNICSWECKDKAEQSKPVMPPGEKPDKKWRDPGCVGKCVENQIQTVCADHPLQRTYNKNYADIYNEPYPKHNSTELNSLIQCVRNSLSSQGKALLSDRQDVTLFTYELKNEACNYSRGNINQCGSCEHAANSCHYGGKTGSNGAEAVDFNAVQSNQENALYRELLKLYHNGNPCKFKFIQFECNHTHISTQDCDSDGTGENIKC